MFGARKVHTPCQTCAAAANDSTCGMHTRVRGEAEAVRHRAHLNLKLKAGKNNEHAQIFAAPASVYLQHLMNPMVK